MIHFTINLAGYGILKINKCDRLYVCCGQYIATLESVKNENVYCPRCGSKLTNKLELPIVLIAKRQ